ncbi:MAG: helix-turn-helix transcriptional regulator [Eubacteriales bacterium]|nr:helix-turn-helix transcriptional regulator [Eubacteriales bacterium]
MFQKSPYYIFKLFRTATGLGILEYIHKYRIDKSIEFLKNGSHTVEGVSEIVGFASRKTFTRLFKKYTGVVPSKFKF